MMYFTKTNNQLDRHSCMLIPGKMLILALLIIFSSFSMKAQDSTLTVYFEFDKCEISESYSLQLIALSKETNSSKCEFLLSGHTDSTGTEDYNWKLAEERAKAVASLIENEGIPSDIITIEVLGETSPLDEAKPELNRRVEIKLTCEKEEVKKEKEKGIDELYRLLEHPTDTFCISSNKDTVLVTNEGSILIVRKNSFNLDPDLLPDCIDLIVKDRKKKSLIIRDNLSTVLTKGDIYISQSMINIDARYQGIPLSLNRDITVLNPSDTIIEEMKLLRGLHPEGERHIEWEIPKGNSNGSGSGSGSGNGGVGSIISCCYDYGEYGVDSANSYLYYAPCDKFICKLCRTKLFRGLKSCDQYKPVGEKKYTNAWTVSTNCDDNCDSLRRVQLQQLLLPRVDYISYSERYDNFEENYSDTASDKILEVTREDVSYYTFNTRLGWSNLDWLRKIENPINYKVFTKSDPDTDIRLVFKDERSIVPLKKADGYYYYNGIPNLKGAWIVGLRYKDDTPYLALKKVITGPGGFSNLTFEKVTIPELIEKLKIMDRE